MRTIAIQFSLGVFMTVTLPLHAAVERTAAPMAVPQAVVVAPTAKKPATAQQSSTLQADRPDFHLPFDYRPAHPSDELHRFPSDDPISPLREGRSDESFRGQLRG